MPANLFEHSCEVAPREAFLYAFDDAIKGTFRFLTDVGLNEESIWTAFSEALELFHTGAAAVDREALHDDF
jgi:hypothetical protein